MAFLEHLENLEYLNLSMTKISDAGLAHIGKLPNLKSLELSSSPDIGPNITDVGLSNLSRFTNLSEINLRLCNQITDAGLAYFDQLPKLTILALAGCKLFH